MNFKMVASLTESGIKRRILNDLLDSIASSKIRKAQMILNVSWFSQTQLDQALWKAVEFQQVELARELLLAGAKVRVKNEQGYTPLIKAIEIGPKEMVQLLLEFGAEVNTMFYREKSLLTVLDFAIRIQGRIELLAILTSKGAFFYNQY